MGHLYAKKEDRDRLADKSMKAFGGRGRWKKKARSTGANLTEIEQAMDELIRIKDEAMHTYQKKMEELNDSKSNESKPKRSKRTTESGVKTRSRENTPRTTPNRSSGRGR